MRFDKETDQTRPAAQLSRGKDCIKNIKWIFLNFFFNFKLISLAFLAKRLLSFTVFENGRCQCHY